MLVIVKFRDFIFLFYFNLISHPVLNALDKRAVGGTSQEMGDAAAVFFPCGREQEESTSIHFPLMSWDCLERGGEGLRGQQV